MTRRSSRHAKITGDFGEALVLYLLSREGFESARVDHVGIDLIARNPASEELMGISVKTRSRSEGTERSSLLIEATNFEKVRFACEAFSCVPYFAIVVDAPPKVWVFVLPMEHLKTLLGPARSPSWKMGEKYLDAYERDPLIKTFTMHAEATGWSW